MYANKMWLKPVATNHTVEANQALAPVATWWGIGIIHSYNPLGTGQGLEMPQGHHRVDGSGV